MGFLSWVAAFYIAGVFISTGYGYYLLGKYGQQERGDYGVLFMAAGVVWPLAFFMAFGLWLGRRGRQ